MFQPGVPEELAVKGHENINPDVFRSGWAFTVRPFLPIAYKGFANSVFQQEEERRQR